MKGGALSLLANASANAAIIQAPALTVPSREKRTASRQASSNTQAMKRSAFGESAEFAIAGTVTHNAVSRTRVRKPSANCFKSSIEVSANSTSTMIETPSITLMSCSPLTGISKSS